MNTVLDRASTSKPSMPPAPAKIQTPPARTVKVIDTPAGKAMIIRETKGRTVLVTSYWLSEVEVGYGRRGFRLAKVIRESGTDTSEDTYDVLTAAEGNSCSCKGFTRWGKCKHTSALVAAEAAGKL